MAAGRINQIAGVRVRRSPPARTPPVYARSAVRRRGDGRPHGRQGSKTPVPRARRTRRITTPYPGGRGGRRTTLRTGRRHPARTGEAPPHSAARPQPHRALGGARRRGRTRNSRPQMGRKVPEIGWPLSLPSHRLLPRERTSRPSGRRLATSPRRRRHSLRGTALTAPEAHTQASRALEESTPNGNACIKGPRNAHPQAHQPEHGAWTRETGVHSEAICRSF